jgi:hypothetical protein
LNNDGKREDIYAFVIVLVHEHFWGHVSICSSNTMNMFIMSKNVNKKDPTIRVNVVPRRQ